LLNKVISWGAKLIKRLFNFLFFPEKIIFD